MRYKTTLMRDWRTVGIVLAIPIMLGLGCVNDTTPQETGPSDGGSSGRLVYCYQPISGPDLDKSIRIIGLDGTGEVLLPDLPVGVNAPDFSPDGSRIAVYGYPTGTTWSIYVMNNDGSNFQRLTTTDGVWDHVPDFSPDGTRIVFSRIYPDQNERTEIWIMNADGTDQHYIGIEGDAAVWSPDGTRLTYSADRAGNLDIYTCNPDGTGEVRLTTAGSREINSAWSPDGSRLAYCTDADGDFEIWVMGADGTDPVRLTNNAAGDFDPTWSPDGSLIAWDTNLAGIANNRWEIYVMTADGSKIWRVTHSPSNATAIHPEWEPAFGGTTLP